MKRVLAIAVCIGLGGCAELGIGPGDVGGALGGGVGGAVGGILGSKVGTGTGRTVATIAGASLGALFGSAIGRKLVQGDLTAMHHATQRTLEYKESGTVTTWRNPDSGHQGTVVASAAEQTDPPCRPFEQTVTVDGETDRVSSVACRQPDGTWEVRAKQ